MALQPIKKFIWGSKFNRALAKVTPAKYSEPNPDFTLVRVLRKVAATTFFTFDRVGLHVMPKHYSTPVPDYTFLRNNPDSWRGRVELRGVDWDLDAQLSWLRSICEPYYGEVRGLKRYAEITETGVGPGYGPIESQLLHCFIRSQRPRLVVEIGSGVSTRIMLDDAERNRQEGLGETHIIAIEPNAREELRRVPGITLNEAFVQKVPLSFFDQLEAGDMLFVDSSHAVKTGSDVVRIFMEIVPRLKPGVFIHIHDISLPYLYPRFAESMFIGWQETTLVLALLMNNEHLKVLCCQSALHYDRPYEMAAITTDYRPQENKDGLVAGDPTGRHCPDSLWLQTC
jgi:predicted O-methyltransferase YrrM